MATSKTVSGVSGLLRHLRFALRSIAERPAFTAIVVGTLALGLGANTATSAW